MLLFAIDNTDRRKVVSVALNASTRQVPGDKVVELSLFTDSSTINLKYKDIMGNQACMQKTEDFLASVEATTSDEAPCGPCDHRTLIY